LTAQFNVIRAFEAIEPISGRLRRFAPGDLINRGSGQFGPNFTIEADMTFYVVDRATFEACCRFKNEPGSAY
jgi:hypothetical protein